MIDTQNDMPIEHNASYLRYLTFIQDVITRMNRSAFQLKGWSITIVAALAALAVDKGSLLLFGVAAISTIPFCLLDAHYLLMERQYRGLYNDVVDGNECIRLFSMRINRYTRKEAKDDVEKKKYTYWWVVCSTSVLGFYGSMFLLCVAGWLVCRNCPLLPQRNSTGETYFTRAESVGDSMPRFWELRHKDPEVRKSGEAPFRWEYKWK